MSDATGNCTVRISTDGTVTTLDRHGVRIHDLCGDLRMLHKILRINRMVGADKAKLPNDIRIRHTTFEFIREDTGEVMQVPVQHIMGFVRHIDIDDLELFIESMKAAASKSRETFSNTIK